MNSTPHIDFSSHAWKQIEKWAQSQLDSARQRNDSIAHDIAQTSALRGEIAVLKRILGLPEAAARDAGITPD